MMPVLALYLLATVDATFIGYRDGAARCARLSKRDHYRRSLVRGAIWGQLAVAIALSAISITLWTSDAPDALLSAYMAAAQRMVIVYGPYALVTVVTMLVRLSSSVDARSLAAVLVFGPLHFVRPAVVLSGAVWGALAAPRAPVIAVLILVSGMMLGLERLLDLLRQRQGRLRVP